MDLDAKLAFNACQDTDRTRRRRENCTHKKRNKRRHARIILTHTHRWLWHNSIWTCDDNRTVQRDTAHGNDGDDAFCCRHFSAMMWSTMSTATALMDSSVHQRTPVGRPASTIYYSFFCRFSWFFCFQLNFNWCRLSVGYSRWLAWLKVLISHTHTHTHACTLFAAMN